MWALGVGGLPHCVGSRGRSPTVWALGVGPWLLFCRGDLHRVLQGQAGGTSEGEGRWAEVAWWPCLPSLMAAVPVMAKQEGY